MKANGRLTAINLREPSNENPRKKLHKSAVINMAFILQQQAQVSSSVKESSSVSHSCYNFFSMPQECDQAYGGYFSTSLSTSS